MKKRLLSAIVALIICIPLVIIGNIPFKILLLIISSIGLLEITKLNTKNKSAIILSIFSFVLIILSNFNKITFDNILDFRFIGLIFILFFILKLIYFKDKEFDLDKCFSQIIITIFLSLAFSIMLIIRNLDLYYFLYLFLITISTDTFAYIIGSLIGTHKLSIISPKKTYEGCIGGSIFGTIISVIFYLSFINNNINIFIIVVITLILSIIGQLGDLFFSLIKRNYKIKDFSNIMPGHGGILDRLDSIIFVMLAITYFINFI
ncbi:MAG: hypothetical protein E7170_00795 [Firmicutes bacterium]|nr:hypothetical protein [Bacillota bacterium]